MALRRRGPPPAHDRRMAQPAPVRHLGRFPRRGGLRLAPDVVPRRHHGGDRAPGRSGSPHGGHAARPHRVLGRELSERAPTAVGTLLVRSADALRRILWAPGELGVARAFVAGDLDVEGDLFALLRVLRAVTPPDLRQLRLRLRRSRGIAAARRWACSAGRCRPRPRSAGRSGRRHSPVAGRPRREPPLRRRQRLLPARARPDHDLLVRPLHARPTPPSRRPRRPSTSSSAASSASTGHRDAPARRRLRMGLDGHPRRPPARCPGRRRHAQPGAGRRGAAPGGTGRAWPTGSRSACRTTASSTANSSTPSPRSACSSTSAPRKWPRYFETLAGLIRPTGRLLNHAISTPGGSVLGRRSFIGRYVFPDGELIDVAEVVGPCRACRVRGTRRRIPSRALQPHAALLGGQPRGELGRGGRPGRAGPVPHLAAVHGRLGQRVRRRRARRPPGPRRRPRRSGASGMPATRAGWEDSVSGNPVADDPGTGRRISGW